MTAFRHLLCTALAICAIHTTSFADEATAPVESTLNTKARPIERKPPRYPTLPLERGQEGWVVVSYVVQSDGTVSAPFVVESSGIDEFEAAAVKTVLGWTYEPATQNGKKVQQCETETKLTFAIETEKRGARRKFMRRYKEIQSLMGSGDIDAAESLLDETMAMGEWNLYEYSRLWLLDSGIANARGDRQAQLDALRKVIGKKGDFVEEDVANAILPIMLQLELSLAQYSDAIETYNEMTKTSQLSEEYQPLVNAINRVLAALDSRQILQSPAEISMCDNCPGRWTYKPLRRDFEFSNVVGKLDEFELRCDWRLFHSAIEDDLSWSIPAEWGKCQLNVYGTPGTTFDFLELPGQVEAVPAAATSAVQ